jgi:outer membrane protein OmpA-like peptidoglycan-associated protein
MHSWGRIVALLTALVWSSPAFAQLDDEKPPSNDEPAADEAGDADAEAGAEESVAASLDSDEPGALEHWWLGAYWRHLWVPGYMLDAFLEQAPSIANNGFGLVGTYRTLEGFNIQFGFGYMPLSFDGPMLAPGSEITDIELAESDLALFHLTGSVLWDIEFHSTIALEIGVGLDLGVFAGEIRRNEAFPDANNNLQRCPGPMVLPQGGADPDGIGPLTGTPYCDVPVTPGASSDPSSEEGEHYNAVEEGIPPAFGFLMLPHVALRIQPFKYLAIKAEFAFGFATMFAGISVHASFGMLQKHPERVFERNAEVGANGRVLGRVLEAGTDVPIAGATVTLKARALSPLNTLDDGRFIVDRLDAGEVRFDIEHDAYLPGHCSVTIEDKGGDVPVVCHLAARARVGSLSGQVKTENGKPIAGARVEIDGPRTERATSDDKGTFGAVDLPEGTYRMRVDAEGYLMQMLEIDVAAQDTAMPKVILIKKPKRSLVTLSQKEIVISQQVRFESSSAEIASSSDPLLREIADVFLRNPQVQLVEIQGHTDNTGSHDRNMALSQERADAVRDWLVQAGVAEGRLEAKGYGPDSPIAPNKSAADKAKNRRVQLIIRRQSAEVGDVEEESEE